MTHKKITALSEAIEATPYGQTLMQKLDQINESQEVFSQSLIHILRTDLLSMTDKIIDTIKVEAEEDTPWKLKYMN